MNIVVVSSEVVPYSKTGGLADVAGALPSALSRQGCTVSVITPLYGSVDREKHGLQRGPKDVTVMLGADMLRGAVFLGELPDGVRSYLVGSAEFFERDELYGEGGKDYADNYRRYAFFCKAALEVVRRYRRHPDVIVCNDWQSALIPVYSHQDYSGYFNTLLTIHNLGYQGVFPKEILPEIGLAWDFYALEGMEYWGQVNLLKGGLMFAGKLSTVSPTYAREIQGGEAGGGLEGVLSFRHDDLSGILNGADYETWDPEVDDVLPTRFSEARLDGKAACKAALQGQFGLPQRPDVPLVGMVSRIDAQKGFDILLDGLDELLAADVQLAVLGTGDDAMEQRVREAQAAHPEKFGLHVAFSERLAHLVIGGADMLLVPSRYEPCGLTQIYALRYGTVPVVRATGGLDDTVTAGLEGDGFKFVDHTAEALVAAVREAAKAYQDGEAWRARMRRAMRRDFSWDRAARRYLDLFSEIIRSA